MCGKEMGQKQMMEDVKAASPQSKPADVGIMPPGKEGGLMIQTNVLVDIITVAQSRVMTFAQTIIFEY